MKWTSLQFQLDHSYSFRQVLSIKMHQNLIQLNSSFDACLHWKFLKILQPIMKKNIIRIVTKLNMNSFLDLFKRLSHFSVSSWMIFRWRLNSWFCQCCHWIHWLIWLVFLLSGEISPWMKISGNWWLEDIFLIFIEKGFLVSLFFLLWEFSKIHFLIFVSF